MNEQPTFLQRMASLRDENLRLRRSLSWAWLAIGALALTTIGACLTMVEVARH